MRPGRVAVLRKLPYAPAMRLRVTLLHDGSNAAVEAALTALWRAIPAEDVDVHLKSLDNASVMPWVRTVQSVRDIYPWLTRDRTDVVHAWLARPALVCGLLRQVPDSPALVTGIPGSAAQMDRAPLASAAHLAAAFLADMVTPCHADTAQWLIRSGLPSAAVAQVKDAGLVDDPAAIARHHMHLYNEVVARDRPTWRRYIRLPRL